MTQKGQVTIPKFIRDLFGLEASDQVVFSVVKDKIVAKPVLRVDEAYGMFDKGIRGKTKKDYKKTIRKRVLDKYGYA